MKIAFIDSKLNLKSGGGTHYQLDLEASALVRLGHEVMVITLSPFPDSYPENLPYPVISEGLASSRFGRNFRLVLQRVFHKYETQVHVYHLNRSWFTLGGALYRRLRGKVPVVASLNSPYFCSNLDFMDGSCWKRCGLMQRVQHGRENLARKTLGLPRHAIGRSLEILLVNHVDAFIPVSPVMAEIYSQQNFDKKRMVVIPAPIDYEYLRKLRENHRYKLFPSGLYNILYVGRLSSGKGVDILIDAISRLDFPLKLHIVGDGPQKNYLQQFAKNLGVSDRVIFHGWVPHEKVADFYLSSQLFIHPARAPEPLGLTILEAMALEVPVIAADCGGPPWALHGTGLTFRTRDTYDLVEKIRLIHGNPSLAASLAQKAQERAKDFDCSRVIPRLLEVYKNVIEEAKTG